MMEAAAGKRFFAGIVMFAIMALMTEAAPLARAPSGLPRPMSDASTIVPAYAIVASLALLLLEAQITPIPAPAPAPSTVSMSDAATAIPAIGVAASVVMLLFGYLF
ncbi:hypothetical protein FCM35_KLT00673 [Carex littledalei]|uniref:Uncharacterized protein n=1 Tax=Carex littledalei TaxID=544730 RepID=A0A833R3L9_9POAL|nr:hypothetical protein FCM35_KLT00673 [Carex littledalei]